MEEKHKEKVTIKNIGLFKSKKITGFQKTLNWKIMNNALPTADILLHRRIITVNNSVCIACKMKETMKHLFQDCQVLGKMWGKICRDNGIDSNIKNVHMERTYNV